MTPPTKVCAIYDKSGLANDPIIEAFVLQELNMHYEEPLYEKLRLQLPFSPTTSRGFTCVQVAAPLRCSFVVILEHKISKVPTNVHFHLPFFNQLSIYTMKLSAAITLISLLGLGGAAASEHSPLRGSSESTVRELQKNGGGANDDNGKGGGGGAQEKAWSCEKVGAEANTFPTCPNAGKGLYDGKEVDGDECQPCCKCDGTAVDYEYCMILSFESEPDVEVPCGGGLISLDQGNGETTCAAACLAANLI